jgi:hypothetical protein
MTIQIAIIAARTISAKIKFPILRWWWCDLATQEGYTECAAPEGLRYGIPLTRPFCTSSTQTPAWSQTACGAALPRASRAGTARQIPRAGSPHHSGPPPARCTCAVLWGQTTRRSQARRPSLPLSLAARTLRAWRVMRPYIVSECAVIQAQSPR